MPTQFRPALSIIIPTLNEAGWLPRLLTDLAHQTWRAFEVIVVDAHSTDNTPEKALTFKPRLPHLTVVNSPKRNVCAQRNLGSRHAQAGELLFVDADDRLDHTFLAELQAARRDHPATLYTTNIKPDRQSLKYRLMMSLSNPYFQLMSRTSRPFFTESLIGISKDAFNKLGGFDPQVPNAEGNVLADKALQAGYHIYIYPSPKYTYSVRRIETDGVWKTIRNFVPLTFTLLRRRSVTPEQARRLHPMEGGHYYR